MPIEQAGEDGRVPDVDAVGDQPQPQQHAVGQHAPDEPAAIVGEHGRHDDADRDRAVEDVAGQVLGRGVVLRRVTGQTDPETDEQVGGRRESP